MRLRFFHAGEQDQVACQVCQTAGLVLDVGQPFVFADVHCQQFSVRVDDGQRCFEFMAGIGDELLLFLVADAERPDDAARQEDQQQQYKQGTYDGHPQTAEQQRARGIQTAAAVEEQDQRLTRRSFRP